jgi:hypothetical protein
LTTVPSINAMLDARIVAARIQGAVAGAVGKTHGAARMTSPSEGGTQNPVTLAWYVLPPDDMRIDYHYRRCFVWDFGNASR